MLLTTNGAGEACQTDLRKLLGTYWPRQEVGGWAHQLADPYRQPTSGPHHWPPPLFRKLPGGSLWSCHVFKLLQRWFSCSGGSFDPCDDTCHALIWRIFVLRIMTYHLAPI